MIFPDNYSIVKLKDSLKFNRSKPKILLLDCLCNNYVRHPLKL